MAVSGILIPQTKYAVCHWHCLSLASKTTHIPIVKIIHVSVVKVLLILGTKTVWLNLQGITFFGHLEEVETSAEHNIDI